MDISTIDNRIYECQEKIKILENQKLEYIKDIIRLEALKTTLRAVQQENVL